MSARIEELRQENRGGDVSSRDIEWLCSVADAAEYLLDWIERQGPAPFSTVDHNFRARVVALRRAVR
jgi:hypothetical protein